MTENFQALIQLAQQASGGMELPTTPAIAAELLHYDILFALSRSQALADKLTFQGGTALRLFHGGQRYSEDLDFTCGADAVEPFNVDDLETILRTHIENRYGLPLTVKAPGDGKSFDDAGITVKRWHFNIAIPGFPRQHSIHFEVCNVPSYEREPMLLQPRYPFLSDAFSDIALRVQTPKEIMEDKIVAIIARGHMKARDLWDLQWLQDRHFMPNLEQVLQKFDDYGLEDVESKIETALARIEDPLAGKRFRDEMRRFLAPGAARMLDEPEAITRWLGTATNWIDRVSQRLQQNLPRPR